ncbi:MAG: radical SAM protein [unclassified Hahellaceae]|nr:radical SAM protein [Hahellaceae bacterium]
MNQTSHSVPVVVNWHLTEACNFSCRYCYAHWERTETIKDLIREEYQVRALVTELGRFFRSDGAAKKFGFYGADPRLNIAGGEPLLVPSAVYTAVHHARRLGLRASLITNGAFLTEELCKSLAPGLDMLGVSIDSRESDTNNLIGRVDSHGQLLNLDALSSSFEVLRRCNPALAVKLNTVVNRLNWKDDLSSVVDLIQPEKWKILRALPVVDQSTSVTDVQFQAFVARHSAYRSIAVVEDNQDMQESYIMVDPQGRFFQNSPCSVGYQYSEPILEVGAERAFSQVAFNCSRFASRYSGSAGGTS